MVEFLITLNRQLIELSRTIAKFFNNHSSLYPFSLKSLGNSDPIGVASPMEKLTLIILFPYLLNKFHRLFIQIHFPLLSRQLSSLF